MERIWLFLQDLTMLSLVYIRTNGDRDFSNLKSLLHLSTCHNERYSGSHLYPSFPFLEHRSSFKKCACLQRLLPPPNGLKPCESLSHTVIVKVRAFHNHHTGRKKLSCILSQNYEGVFPENTSNLTGAPLSSFIWYYSNSHLKLLPFSILAPYHCSQYNSQIVYFNCELSLVNSTLCNCVPNQ